MGRKDNCGSPEPMERKMLQKAELANQPMLLPGFVNHWPALEQWSGRAGVLRMTQLAGQAQVQAMISTNQESLFFGDMRQHTPQTCSFADYLSSLTNSYADQSESAGEPPYQAYLAQASLDSGQQLAALKQDFDVPQAISHVEVTHTNLWMSIRGSRASLHYDPYHNLLCLVQGMKTVKLMSPEITDQLYPLSILGESPNHSHIDFAHPDFEQHPLYRQALASQQEFNLQAGDALFIPEGWWHQVDSQDTTIAINFWWLSAFSKSLQPHMHPYFLRRLLDGLLDTHRHKALASVQPHPQLHALQTALGTVSGQHDSDKPSEMSSPESSDASLSLSEEEEPAAAASPIATVPSAGQTRQSTVALTASVLPQAPAQPGDTQGDHDTPEATQSARPTESEAIGLNTAGSCNSSRKRKAPDLSAEDTLDQADTAHQYPTRLPHGHQQQPSPFGQNAEGLLDLRQGAEHATTGQLAAETVSPPLTEDIAAAEGPFPQHAASTTADAEHAVVHMAAIELLAIAVADCLDNSEDQKASVGLEHPITCILASLQPQDVQAVLAMMARRVPRTLEALLLHALPPAAAELLTQKLEQADASATATGRQDHQHFYTNLYCVTSDPQKALHALLDKKEAFSQQVCQGLISRLLGIHCSFPSTSSP